MIKDYFSLAFENLRHRGLRSWLTILGVVIGIAAVVSLIGLGAGLKTAILGQFGTLSVDTLTIQNKGSGFGPPGSTVVEKLNDNDVRIIESISGVDNVVTRLVRVVKVEYNGITSFEYVVDVPDDKEDIDFVKESFDFEMADGRFIEEGDSRVIVLGSSAAEGARFKEEIRVGKKLLIEGQSFEVIGILDKSSSLQMNSVYFLPKEDLENILGIDKEYDMIVAKVHDKDDIELISNELSRKFRSDRNEKLGEETFSVETPLQSLNAVNTILNIVNGIVVGIAMISLLVGGIGIANTMYTSVLERTKEIGTMKAIGAKNSDILWIFIIESGLLGLVGGIAGALIGLGTSVAIASIANQTLGTNLFQISIDYYLLLGSITFSFIIGIASGVFPALQASRLNVVDALRGGK